MPKSKRPRNYHYKLYDDVEMTKHRQLYGDRKGHHHLIHVDLDVYTNSHGALRRLKKLQTWLGKAIDFIKQDGKQK